MTDKKTQQGASREFMDAFCALMDQDFLPCLAGQKAVAVAVSGGADSLALCFALAEYLAARGDGVVLHVITVDHGLRAEATAEAAYVGRIVGGLPNVKSVVLTWAHDDVPDARIQERARAARYDLMGDYMKAQGIRFLFLGHHMDDQAETFLFRLAKGSGLDGLACMAARQEMESGVVLCRPLLSFAKVDMVGYCAARGIEFVEDPSNRAEKFARVRLRKSMDVLAVEGITPKRLSVTAMRLARARRALDEVAQAVYEACLFRDTGRVELNCEVLLEQPDEIVLRVILCGMQDVNSQDGYGARMERVENLCADFLVCLSSGEGFRKRTLGGVVFEYDKKRHVFVLSSEV